MKQRGFTLFEFVIVVVVIALLAGVSTIYYSKTMERVKVARVELLANRFGLKNLLNGKKPL